MSSKTRSGRLGYDAFLARLGPSGSWLWARNLGPTDEWSGVRHLALNGKGHLYVLGSFGGSKDLVSRFDPIKGQKLLGWGTLELQSVRDVLVDDHGRLAITGSFHSQIQLGAINLQAPVAESMFVWRTPIIP